MNQQMSLVVFVVGLSLIIYGIGASNSFSFDVSRIFTGSPADRTIALMCGGAVFTVLGGYGLSRQPD